MEEEKFQKKVINKLIGIDRRLRNIEERLNNIENAMNSISEDVEDEEYEGDDASSPEPEGNNITRILPPHKDIKGYI